MLLNQQDRLMERYLRADLLIIDDMGMKQLPKRSGEYLFEIIMRRYQVRSTMMTSNRPLEDWGKLIGDVPATTAILDRFLHNAEVIAITGRSYRLRHHAQATDPEAEQRRGRPSAGGGDGSLMPRGGGRTAAAAAAPRPTRAGPRSAGQPPAVVGESRSRVAAHPAMTCVPPCFRFN